MFLSSYRNTIINQSACVSFLELFSKIVCCWLISNITRLSLLFVCHSMTLNLKSCDQFWVILWTWLPFLKTFVAFFVSLCLLWNLHEIYMKYLHVYSQFRLNLKSCVLHLKVFGIHNTRFLRINYTENRVPRRNIVNSTSILIFFDRSHLFSLWLFQLHFSWKFKDNTSLILVGK